MVGLAVFREDHSVVGVGLDVGEHGGLLDGCEDEELAVEADGRGYSEDPARFATDLKMIQKLKSVYRFKPFTSTERVQVLDRYLVHEERCSDCGWTYHELPDQQATLLLLVRLPLQCHCAGTRTSTGGVACGARDLRKRSRGGEEKISC